MKTRIYSAILFMSVALVACDNLSDGDYRLKKGTIGFTKTNITKVETKAAGEAVLVGEAKSENISLAVTCQEEIFTDQVETKAAAITKSTLDEFAVHGFLGSEIDRMEGASAADKGDHHFIKAQVAESTDHNLWHFKNDQYWRNGVNHTFWAYYPTDLDVEVSADYGSATFAYAPDNFDTDLIVSTAKRYYGKEEETSLRDNALSLTFNHALAAVTANTAGVNFMVKNGEIITSDPDRGEVISVAKRDIHNSGICTTNGTSFSWELDENHSNDEEFADNGLRFYPPQQKEDGIIVLTIKDNKRLLTRPYAFDAKTLIGEGMWESGKKYTYNFEGNIVFPYLSSDIKTGIEVNFSGNKFHFLSVLEDFDVKYIQRIRVTWKGLPTGNAGNGTIAFISMEEAGKTNEPKAGDYVINNSPNTANKHLIFAYNLKNKEVNPGSVDGTTCTAEFDIPSDIQNPVLYAAFNGSNNSSTCAWHLDDFTIEVIGWR